MNLPIHRPASANFLNLFSCIAFLVFSINISVTALSKLAHKSSFFISFLLLFRFKTAVLIPLKLKSSPLYM